MAGVRSSTMILYAPYALVYPIGLSWSICQSVFVSVFSGLCVVLWSLLHGRQVAIDKACDSNLWILGWWSYAKLLEAIWSYRNRIKVRWSYLSHLVSVILCISLYVSVAFSCSFSSSVVTRWYSSFLCIAWHCLASIWFFVPHACPGA